MPSTNGGVIGLKNTPTQNSAGGMWGLKEHLHSRQLDIWPPKATPVSNLSFSTVTDPYFSSTSLIISDRLADESNAGLTLTIGSDVSVSSSQVKAGLRAIRFAQSNDYDGSANRILLPTSDRLDFGNGDFTIECWVYFYFSGTVSSDPYVSKTYTPHLFGGAGNFFRIFADMEQQDRESYNDIAPFTAKPDDFPVMRQSGQTPEPSATRRLTVLAGGVTITTPVDSLSSNAWTHIAVTKEVNNLSVFIDGVLAGSGQYSVTDTFSLSDAAIGNLSQTSAPPGSTGLRGYLDNIRITKGICRYNSNFTPSTDMY